MGVVRPDRKTRASSSREADLGALAKVIGAPISAVMVSAISARRWS